MTVRHTFKCTAGLILLLSFCMPAQENWLTPPADLTGQAGIPLECSFQTASTPEWITLFIKTSAESDYSALQVKTIGQNQFQSQIPREMTLGGDIQYYLVGKINGAIRYYPADAPGSVLHIQIRKGDADKGPDQPPPKPDPHPKSTRLLLNFSGGGENTIHFKDPDMESEPTHQHAMSIQVGMSRDDFQMNLQSRLAYSGQDFNNGDQVDLAQLSASVQMGQHLLELGDQNFTQSEYSLSSLGRRGILYKHEGMGFQWQAFALNSQQLYGFRGFGVPKSNLGLFGGVLGYRSSDWKLNLLYLSGKDDPALGNNNAFSPSYMARKGSLVSLFGDLSLLRQQLTLSAEVAFSSHDGNLEDDLGPESGTAWKADLQGQLKSWTIQAFYHDIGRSFNTIGQPFFTSDRRRYGANSSLQLSQTLTWGLTYQTEQTGSDNQPADPLLPYQDTILSRNSQLNSSLSLRLTDKLNLSLGATKAWQEARQNNLILPEGAIDRLGITLGLNWMMARGATLFINSGIDQITSESAPDRQGKSQNIQIGGNFGSGDGFSLTPGINLTRQENPQSGESTTIWGGSLNGRMNLFTRYISLDFTGSYNHMNMPSMSSSNIMVDGGLSLESADLLKFARVAFSLRGAYISSESYGTRIDDYRIYLRGDYAIQ